MKIPKRWGSVVVSAQNLLRTQLYVTLQIWNLQESLRKTSRSGTRRGAAAWGSCRSKRSRRSRAAVRRGGRRTMFPLWRLPLRQSHAASSFSLRSLSCLRTSRVGRTWSLMETQRWCRSRDQTEEAALMQRVPSCQSATSWLKTTTGSVNAASVGKAWKTNTL